MRICSGDIIVVKNIKFKNGNKDNLETGRSCIVLFLSKDKDNKEYVTFLPMSAQYERLLTNKSVEKYIEVLKHKGKFIVNLDEVLVKEVNSDIIKTCGNIGDDFFRVVKKLQKYENFKNKKNNLDEFFEETNNKSKELCNLLYERKSKFINRAKYVNHDKIKTDKNSKIGHLKKLALKEEHYLQDAIY